MYALLGSRNPSRSLIAYLAAGLAVSLAVGVTAVAVFHHAVPNPVGRTPRVSRDIAEIIIGAGCLGAAAYHALRRTVPPEERPVRAPGGMTRRLRDPSISSAAVAGVLTHLPAAFYLTALAAIATSGAGLAGDVVQVGVYNVLWFAIPVVALASWILRPENTRDRAAGLTMLIQRRRRELTVAVLGAVGLYLVVAGTVGLLQH